MVNSLTRLRRRAQQNEPVSLRGRESNPKLDEEVDEEITREKNINTQKFEDVVQDSQQRLLKIKGVFPFDFFPNEVLVDLKNVTIITNSFLFKDVHSIYVQDISDVLVHEGIFFASLEVVDKFFRENSVTVNYLSKSDAEKARNVIQGLMVASREVDMSKVETEKLPEKVEAVGELPQNPL